MKSKVIRPQVNDIQKRFFEAFDLLIESDQIKSMQSFCTHYELHRPKYSNLRTLAKEGRPGTGYKLVDLDALAYLVRDFGVSADWLLLGRGGMFKTKKGA